MDGRSGLQETGSKEWVEGESPANPIVLFSSRLTAKPGGVRLDHDRLEQRSSCGCHRPARNWRVTKPASLE